MARPPGRRILSGGISTGVDFDLLHWDFVLGLVVGAKMDGCGCGRRGLDDCAALGLLQLAQEVTRKASEACQHLLLYPLVEKRKKRIEWATGRNVYLRCEVDFYESLGWWRIEQLCIKYCSVGRCLIIL